MRDNYIVTKVGSVAPARGQSAHRSARAHANPTGLPFIAIDTPLIDLLI